MAQQAITVELPDEVYKRVQRTARGMRQPLEQVLVRIVTAAMPSLDKVPAAYRAELEALETLSDEDLWQVAQHQLPAGQQHQLTRLQRKHQRGTITAREQQAMTRLRTEIDRVMLRRSYAYLLLRCRGHRIPTWTELTQG
jgi:predicted transcriptional regulator